MIQERIVQFIEYKGFTKYKFYQMTKLSNGFLDKKGTIGADKCEIIYYCFPEINLEWLLTGEGSMIKPIDNKIPNFHMTESERKKALFNSFGDIASGDEKLQAMVEKLTKESALKDIIIEAKDKIIDSLERENLLLRSISNREQDKKIPNPQIHPG